MRVRSRGSSDRLSGSSIGSRASYLLLAMFATMAAIYVAGRLWQDAEIRLRLRRDLHARIGLGQAAVSVDDNLKIISSCREQQKKLSALEVDLASAKKEGFVGNGGSSVEQDVNRPTKKLLAVLGIMTTFGRKKNRDAIRKSWMPKGDALIKLEEEMGIVVRFVIGRSASQGDSLDSDIEYENRQNHDFLLLNGHVEATEEVPEKTKSFFVHAVEKWDAEFYAKVNDDVYVNIDTLGTTLSGNLDKPRAYIGCMKSGLAISEQTSKWYEPDWWKFGDGKSYFRHASSEIYAISRALAHFVLINRSILRTYAHDDISTGSWFIGLDVDHINEVKFCCSSWSTGALCAAGG